MLDDVKNYGIQSEGLVAVLYRSSEGPQLFAAELNAGEVVCATCRLVEPVAAPCC